MGQGLGLPHKGSPRAGWAVEAWFGTSTVASLAQPSGVGESSGNERSGEETLIVYPTWCQSFYVFPIRELLKQNFDAGNALLI